MAHYCAIIIFWGSIRESGDYPSVAYNPSKIGNWGPSDSRPYFYFMQAVCLDENNSNSLKNIRIYISHIF